MGGWVDWWVGGRVGKLLWAVAVVWSSVFWTMVIPLLDHGAATYELGTYLLLYICCTAVVYDGCIDGLGRLIHGRVFSWVWVVALLFLWYYFALSAIPAPL